MTLDENDLAVQRQAFSQGASELFEEITGKRTADVTSDAMTNSPRAMLEHLYPGRSERQAIDTAQAAKRLGVSQRTVQRWIREDRIPRTEPLTKLRTRTRQSVTTKRGRAQMLKRATTPTAHGTPRAPAAGQNRRLTVHGLQGPGADPNATGTDRPRYGNSNITMTPEQQTEFYEAWSNGGDTAAVDYLSGVFDRGYVAGWHFHGIDGITWRDAPN